MKYFRVIFAVVFCLIIVFAAVKNASFDSQSVFSSSAKRNSVIILDAGHGGEDGGAVAPDGTAEKDINLKITNDTAALFEIFGITYIPVRTSDISVCDDGLQTLKERKKSDIRNREKLVNSIENSIFFSIHQNMFSQSQYSGTQVFYGAENPESEKLAQYIQDAVVKRLQPDNTRQIKPSGKSIYLLYNAKRPSVMTECGFLSNPDELLLLKDETYQKKMAYSVFCGLINYLSYTEDN